MLLNRISQAFATQNDYFVLENYFETNVKYHKYDSALINTGKFCKKMSKMLPKASRS